MISDDGSVDAASVEAATEGGEPIAWLRALLAQRGAKLVKTTTQLAAMEAKCAALAEQNEALERGQSKLAKQVDVTINFVEWFAERGEAYVFWSSEGGRGGGRAPSVLCCFLG